MSEHTHIALLGNLFEKTSFQFQDSFYKSVVSIGNVSKNMLLENSREMYFGTDTDAESVKKERYLAHALQVSYLMQGKSANESALKFFEGITLTPNQGKTSHPPRRVQSYLGGKFLRMYLEHSVDPDAIEDAGKEIKQSPEFTVLKTELQTKLQHELTDSKTLETDIRRISETFLRNKLRKGFAFRYELNTVIGGVSGLEVNDVRVLSINETDITQVNYTVVIRISDAYDFDNKRSGEYELYRQKLADLLKAKKFREFEVAYITEVLSLSERKTSLDNAGIFASYMFALEKALYTKGSLYWSVQLPLDGYVKIHSKKVKKLQNNRQ